jgi:hypothetical protein
MTTVLAGDAPAINAIDTQECMIRAANRSNIGDIRGGYSLKKD